MSGAFRGFSADEVLPCGMSVAAQGFSAYTDAGTELRPAAAYPGLGPGLKLISAIVDSVLWDDPAWAYAVLAWAFGERQPRTSTQTERFFADHGWRDVDDVLQAAGLSVRQASVYVGCELERLEARVMAERLGITPLNVKVTLINARGKVLRFMGVDEAPAPPPTLFADPLTGRKGTEWSRLGTGGWQKRVLWNERDEDA